MIQIIGLFIHLIYSSTFPVKQGSDSSTIIQSRCNGKKNVVEASNIGIRERDAVKQNRSMTLLKIVYIYRQLRPLIC